MALEENQLSDDLSGSSRLGSIMEMDYEIEDDNDDSLEDDGEESETDEDEKESKKSQISEDSKKSSKKEKSKPSDSKTDEDDDDDEESEEDDEEDDSEDDDEEDDSKEKEKTEDGKIKIKYRVDGEDQEGEFTEKELASFISSHKANLRRMTEFDREKKQIAAERESEKQEIDFIVNELKELKGSFSDVIESFDKTGRINSNPVESVYNLLDKMGLDPSKFERAVFFHHIPEVAKFLDMNKEGQEAYLAKSENKWLRKREAALRDKERQAVEYKTKLEAENSVKRQAGISEEEFIELRSELEGFGLKDIKTQQVIEWRDAKPYYVRAQGIAEKVSGADVDKIAKILIAYPQTTDEMILEKLGYKSIREEELKNKLGKKAKKNRRVKDDSFYEKEADSMFNSIFNRR